MYGFYDECIRKYGSPQVWKYIMDCCDYLPLAAIIEKDIFCVHGGLSPTLDSIEKINKIDRVKEIPHDGPFADLMWSDPDLTPGWKQSQRGAGFNFGQDITEGFLRANNLKLFVRAHQMMPEGYELIHNNKLATVFSAPNYCFRSGNKGGVMEVDTDLSYKFI